MVITARTIQTVGSFKLIMNQFTIFLLTPAQSKLKKRPLFGTQKLENQKNQMKDYREKLAKGVKQAEESEGEENNDLDKNGQVEEPAK